MREEESIMIAPPVINAWFLANVEFPLILRNEHLLPGLVLGSEQKLAIAPPLP